MGWPRGAMPAASVPGTYLDPAGRGLDGVEPQRGGLRPIELAVELQASAVIKTVPNTSKHGTCSTLLTGMLCQFCASFS